MPTWLSTHISPPIISANRFEIARPSPVPPYLRLVEVSTWLKDWNRRCSRSAGMPIPVSRTAQCSTIGSPLSWSALADGAGLTAGVALILNTTSPLSVNLMALFSRLISTCRKRETSLMMAAGTSGPTSSARSRFLAAAGVDSRSIAPSRHSRRSKAVVSSSILPASIFEKSRMSLMIVSSASPLVRIISANSCCCGSSFVFSSSPLIPMIAFIGVRISWLMVARKALFAWLAASASRRADWASSSSRTFSMAIAAWRANPDKKSRSTSLNCPSLIKRYRLNTPAAWYGRCSSPLPRTINGATIKVSGCSSCSGVPSIWVPRGSFSASGMISASPLFRIEPIIPWPGTIVSERNCSAYAPSATAAW